MQHNSSSGKTLYHIHMENEERLKADCKHLADELGKECSDQESTSEAINIVSKYLDSGDETRVYFAIQLLARKLDTSISFNKQSVIDHLILEVKVIELFLVHLQKYDISPGSFMAFATARCILNAFIVIGENVTFKTYIHETGIITPLRDELDKIIKKEKIKSIRTYQNAYQSLLGELAEEILKIM